MTERPLVHNASDATQVKKAKKAERFNRRQDIADIRSLMKTDFGRRFVWRLLKRCGAFETVYNSDPILMGHNSGEQDIGHFILGELQEASPAALVEMMQRDIRESERENEEEKDGE